MSRRCAHPRRLRVRAAAVAALGAEDPLGDADQAQLHRPVAAVDEAHAHLLDRALAVDAPGDAGVERAAPVADDAVALAVRDAVFRLGLAGRRRRHAPRLQGAHVLEHEPLAGRVGDGVVRPGREHVEAAVQGPGVAAAGLADLGAEARVGEDVDPRPRRPRQRADVEAELAAGGGEVADRAIGVAGDRPHLAAERDHRDSLALLERALVQLDELLHVVGERAAVGVEANAR